MIMKTILESILISGICSFFLFWCMIAVSNPKNIIAVIYWKNGKITRKGIFAKMSDFEEYRDYMYKNNKKFDKIEYEYYDKNNSDHTNFII